jgi:hypothetical protein
MTDKPMPLKAMIENAAPLHRRRITVTTYPVTDHRVVVEGELLDERLVEIYRHWDSKPRSKGPVHGLIVRLLVGSYPITILDAEAQMPTVPNDLCRDADTSVKKVIGTQIRAGYSEHIRDLIGGTSGCTHLTHLVVVMGPPALHGFWTLYAQSPRPAPKSLEEVEGLEYLINSCHLWQEGGSYLNELKQIIAEQAKPEK